MSSVVSVSSSLLPDLPLLQTSCSSFSSSWKELSMARQLHPVVNKNRKSCSVVKFSSIPRAAAAASSTSAAKNQAAVGAAADAAAAAKKNNKNKEQTVDTLVQQIHTVEEFDAAMRAAGSKLVVVEYAASHSEKSKKIYPAMVDLSIACQDVVFLLILGDETDDTKELCDRAGIEKVPHFVFYRNNEVVHEEQGIDEEQLQGDVLYYGDPDAPILQLHGRADFEALLQEHKADDKLLVIDVGLKNCGPCVKVYPTFIKLSKKMAGNAIFARMHGDENDDCKQLMREMNVVEVPTFLFVRDGKLCGRYVGSGRGELIGEILRHQGVRVTY
ncbi:unnamed protein product [Sphagnum troendelagicum]